LALGRATVRDRTQIRGLFDGFTLIDRAWPGKGTGMAAGQVTAGLENVWFLGGIGREGLDRLPA
jgi:hypothetical protein